MEAEIVTALNGIENAIRLGAVVIAIELLSLILATLHWDFTNRK